MAEIETKCTSKRRIWIAVLLSLILPGLGQVYCGRLTKGLIFTVLNVLPVFLMLDILLLGTRAVLVLYVIGLLAFGVIIQIISIIDSIYLAKSIGSNYELKEYNKWYVYLLLILLVVGSGSAVGIGPHRGNLVEAFRVTASSMYPTIFFNDRVLANKTIYRKIEPRRGDLVICINPETRKQNSIKRVVAIAGDRVEMKNNQLYINGVMLERQPLLQIEFEGLKGNNQDPNFQDDIFYEINNGSKYKIFLSNSADEKIQNFPEITIPRYNCFVLGDNRNDSYDSRNYGPIPVATIKGRADWLYWPLSRFGRLN